MATSVESLLNMQMVSISPPSTLKISPTPFFPASVCPLTWNSSGFNYLLKMYVKPSYTLGWAYLSMCIPLFPSSLFPHWFDSKHLPLPLFFFFFLLEVRDWRTRFQNGARLSDSSEGFVPLPHFRSQMLQLGEEGQIPVNLLNLALSASFVHCYWDPYVLVFREGCEVTSVCVWRVSANLQMSGHQTKCHNFQHDVAGLTRMHCIDQCKV